MGVQDQPQRHIPLTDLAGDALTEDGDMPGRYTIHKTGARTADFYLTHDGSLNIEAMQDQFLADTAITLIHELQLYVNGVWLSVPAWDSGTLNAAEAQGLNSAPYPKT